MGIGILILLVAGLAVLASMIRIMPEYERAIVLRLGRVLPQPKGPGLIILLPFIDRIDSRVSVRTITMDIDPQDVITKDNISLKVNAVLYFKVIDPMKAILNVENFLYATSQLAQTQLRSVLGEASLDQLLMERKGLNSKLQEHLDENTDPWGIKVISVEVKHVDLPPDQQRSMARQAEAERERRAKVIIAEGELQAATKLKEAADEISKNPVALQLRYLQTAASLGGSQSKVVYFPMPVEIGELIKSIVKK